MLSTPFVLFHLFLAKVSQLFGDKLVYFAIERNTSLNFATPVVRSAKQAGHGDISHVAG